jgi:hypothetical protein
MNVADEHLRPAATVAVVADAESVCDLVDEDPDPGVGGQALVDCDPPVAAIAPAVGGTVHGTALTVYPSSPAGCERRREPGARGRNP